MLKRHVQEQLGAIPSQYLDPLSLEIMVDPVDAEDGHTYDRERIGAWLERKQTSPITHQPMGPALVPNAALEAEIRGWKRRVQSSLSPDGAQHTTL